jgi:hypothetical protein
MNYSGRWVVKYNMPETSLVEWESKENVSKR